MEIVTLSPEQTYAFGQKIGERIGQGIVLCLVGDLGAGKTLLVQGIAAGLGVDEDVTSPTFSLLNIYEGRYAINHFDLYRLDDIDELEEIGFYEYAQREDDVVIIEWPDKFLEAIPDDAIWITLTRGESEDERRIQVMEKGDRYSEFYRGLSEFC